MLRLIPACYGAAAVLLFGVGLALRVSLKPLLPWLLSIPVQPTTMTGLSTAHIPLHSARRAVN